MYGDQLIKLLMGNIVKQRGRKRWLLLIAGLVITAIALFLKRNVDREEVVLHEYQKEPLPHSLQRLAVEFAEELRQSN